MVLAGCYEMNIREPEFLEICDLFRVNLYHPTYKTDANTEEKCPENALETDKLHYNCTVNVPEIALKENPHATAVELAENLRIALRIVKNHIAILKQGGFIERVVRIKWNIGKLQKQETNNVRLS